jgi:alpha-N-arabinofuranosidase
VLGHCYEYVDYVSMHSYYTGREHDRASFLACATGMDSFIEDLVATADHVRAKGRHAKRINLSFDEWNVWHTLGYQPEGDWERAPRLIEDTYDLTDAVVVGNLLISLLRHADRVRMACQAQLVNAIGLIRSEPGGPAWRQTIFHPFALTSKYGRGTVLRTPVAAPEYDTPAYGAVPRADAVAVLSGADDELTVFAVNRDQREPLPAVIDVRSMPGLRVAHHTYLGDDDPSAANTRDAPDRIVPRSGATLPVDGGLVRLALPPLSWNMIRIGGGNR